MSRSVDEEPKLIWQERLRQARYSLSLELGLGRPWRLLMVNGLVACLPAFAMYRTRAALYRLAGFSVAKGAVIHGKLTLMAHGAAYSRLHIGEGARINFPCTIGLMSPVVLEDRAVIGHGATIITALHESSSPDCRAGPVYGQPVRVCTGAWIAANVTLLPGVTIGRGAIVGAGSVVSRDIPAHTFAAGVPARPIRRLPPEVVTEGSERKLAGIGLMKCEEQPRFTGAQVNVNTSGAGR